jgi:hypothetical protein
MEIPIEQYFVYIGGDDSAVSSTAGVVMEQLCPFIRKGFCGI